jgi:hypothetical protein
MSRSTRKMREVLQEDYGVDPGFTDPLVPLLERFAEAAPSPQEWQDLVQGLVAAYRASQKSSPEPREEVNVLLHDAGAELRKLDESLKVLRVYLLRIQRTLKREFFHRVLH